jgi:thiol-disulfide isomerase/thioredoxin
MDAEFLRASFESALDYERYLATDPGREGNWRAVERIIELTPAQINLLRGFTRRMPVLVISGIWCGDCVQQGPMLLRIAQASPVIDLRWVDRDVHRELAEQVQICGGLRVPTVIFMAEDFELVHVLGDRTLTLYRAMAARTLGPSCPVPHPPGAEESAETLQEWLNEFERVHLLLRLSARLRERHGD